VLRWWPDARPRPRAARDSVTDDHEHNGQHAPAEPDAATGPRARLKALKAARARVLTQANDTRRRLEDARPRSRTVDSAFRVASHDSETGGGVLGAAVGFRVFLFLIPYVFVIVVIFDVSASISSKSPKSVAKQAGIGGLVAQSVAASAKHLNGGSRYVALIVGLVAVLTAARSLLKTLQVVHALVWRVRLRKRTKRFRAAIALIVLITIAGALSLGVDRLRHQDPIVGVAALLLFMAVPGGVWLLISIAMPHAPKAGWRDLLPGAILFAISFLLMHALTVYWIARKIEKKSAMYGAIGSALTLLLWAYVIGRIMTAAAVLNASLWERGHPHPAPGRIAAVATPGGADLVNPRADEQPSADHTPTP
jgi:uncharacterized BrkB/YihY/UPF0761 family membrane protein